MACKSNQTNRRGMTLFELTMALFIVSTSMVAIVQVVAMAATQRRTLDQRRLAQLEVANQAERMALLSWKDTSPKDLTTWQPSAELAAALPLAKCAVEVTDEPSQPMSRRIRLTVTWPNSVGQEIEPAAVTIWRFAEEGQP
jgi:Tfp pilus assembly protein PilV